MFIRKKIQKKRRIMHNIKSSEPLEGGDIYEEQAASGAKRNLLNGTNGMTAIQAQSVAKSSAPPSDQVSDDEAYKKVFLVKLVMVASVGGFLFGYDTGIVSGAVLYLQDSWPGISDE